jgi:hypothetical protein
MCALLILHEGFQIGYISVASAAPFSHAYAHRRLARPNRLPDPRPQRDPISRQRERIERTIEALIAVLDMLDGDPDAEPNGDEHDFTQAVEEDWEGHTADCGPGTIEDAEEDNEDCSELEHGAAWGGECVTQVDEDTEPTPRVSVSPLKTIGSQSLVE